MLRSIRIVPMWAGLAVCLVAVLVVLAPRGAGAIRSTAAQSDGAAEAAIEQAAPSTQQLGFLADGRVTREELETALERAAVCLEEHGIQPVRPGHPQLEGRLTVMAYFPDTGSRDAGREVLRSCIQAHSALVESAWRNQSP